MQPPPEVEPRDMRSTGCLPAGGQPVVTKNATRIRGLGISAYSHWENIAILL